MLVYGVAGGTAGLYLGLRERWWETRLLTFSGGWWLLAAANDRLETHWVTLVAGIILAAPVWWHGLRTPRVLPIHLRPLEPPRTDGGEVGWSAGEALYFFVTPLLLAWAVRAAAPDRLDATAGLVALVVAIPYLLAGYLRPLPPFAAVGAAAAGQWRYRSTGMVLRRSTPCWRSRSCGPRSITASTDRTAGGTGWSPSPRHSSTSSTKPQGHGYCVTLPSLGAGRWVSGAPSR